MKSNLLQFLFGESQVREEAEDVLDENFQAMLEKAAAEEDKEMSASKKSLSAALSDVGLKCCKSDGPEDNILCLDSREDYADAVRKLGDPDVMHKLAVDGWVATLGGDVSMHNEEPHYTIHFLEIKTADSGDSDKAEKVKKIVDKAREFATTELDRDDDSNPVEAGDGDMTKVKLPKAKDGKTPESVKEGLAPQALADQLLETERADVKALLTKAEQRVDKLKKKGFKKEHFAKQLKKAVNRQK